MKTLIKIFVALLLLVFIVPLLWLVFKEIFYFFGGVIGGLFTGVCIGAEFGWFILAIIFIAIIIWILSNWN